MPWDSFQHRWLPHRDVIFDLEMIIGECNTGASPRDRPASVCAGEGGLAVEMVVVDHGARGNDGERVRRELSNSHHDRISSDAYGFRLLPVTC